MRSLASSRQVTAAAAPSQQALAVIEADGTWQKAQKVGPVISASDIESVTGVACPAAGKCLLAGVILAPGISSGFSSFVVTESGKKWSKPARFASLGITTLACPAAGRCVAGGTDDKGIAAIMQQKSGRWQTPSELPSARDLSHGTKKAQESAIDYLACPSAGNCSVGGGYSWAAGGGNPGEGVFVGGEANGGWAHVRIPAGIAGLSTGLLANFTGLSCASAANCAAGGEYFDAGGNPGAFLIAEIPAR